MGLKGGSVLNGVVNQGHSTELNKIKCHNDIDSAHARVLQ